MDLRADNPPARLASESTRSSTGQRLKASFAALAFLLVAVLLLPRGIRVAWTKITHLIDLRGDTLAAAPADFSGRLNQQLGSLPAQQQAELLMQESINQSTAAIELVPRYSNSWLGKLTLTPELSGALHTAMTANDLRVRADGLEVYLAVYNVPKTPLGTAKLVRLAKWNPAGRAWALWMLGAVGNRRKNLGESESESEQAKILGTLLVFIHDPDQQTRYWAVEGLANFGSDATIAPLLGVLRGDPAASVRERAACSLAQSGMLSRQQRLTAVPALIEMTEGASLDATAKAWAYQALAGITGQPLAHNPESWRAWWQRQSVH